MFDDLVIDQGIDLDDDAARIFRRGAAGFLVDHGEDLFPQGEGRHDQSVPAGRGRKTGDDVEQCGNIAHQQRIVGKIAQVGIEFRSFVVVIAGTEMDITVDAVFFAPDHQERLAVDLELGDAVDHVCAGLGQFHRPVYVVLLFETGFEFHQHGHLLAVAGRPDQGLHHRRTPAADPVEGLLDRQHIRIVRRGLQQTQDRIESQIRMMQQERSVFPDGAENIAVAVIKGMERQRRQRRIVELRQMLQRGQFGHRFQVQQTGNRLDQHFFRRDIELRDQPFPRPGRHVRGIFQPDDAALGLLPQRQLQFGQQIRHRVRFQCEIHVAGDAESGTFPGLRTGEKQFQMIADQFFGGDENQPFGGIFQQDEPGDDRRHFQQGIFFRFGIRGQQTDQHFQSEIRDQRERMFVVDRDRRQHRIELRIHDIRGGIFLRGGQVLPADDPDPVLLQLRQDLLFETAVLPFDQTQDAPFELGHQLDRLVAVILVDFLVSFVQLGGDSGEPDHAEFIQVVADDGNEIQPFEQRIAGIGGLIEHAGIEFGPADVPVDETDGRFFHGATFQAKWMRQA